MPTRDPIHGGLIVHPAESIILVNNSSPFPKVSEILMAETSWSPEKIKIVIDTSE
jgi:hypothetical protein